jgi:RNA 2',3'-cyclic 3'-phosphodiesterase
MEIRSFLAFELPEQIKTILHRVLADMRQAPLDIRWVRVENIHLTVIFTGNIEMDLLDDMSDIVKGACDWCPPLTISLKSAGVFSSRRNPRVLWIGLDGDIEKMSVFKNRLEEGLGPFGIKEEKRSFSPHLTLGRFKKGAKLGVQLDDLLLKYGGLESPRVTLNELVLFKSELTPKGAKYSRLNAWPMIGEVETITQ